MTVLLTMCLLLAGCAPGEPVASLTDTGGTQQAQAAITLRWGIPAYALEAKNVREIHPLGSGFLLVGDTLTALDDRFLPVGTFDCQDFQLWHGGVACYLSESRRLVMLNHRLEEVTHITLPQETVGTPRISQDAKRIWYCTNNALRVWDLESGIRRRVCQLHEPLNLTGLAMEDTVLICQTQEATRFLDAQNGVTLREIPGNAVVTTENGRFFAALPQSTRTDYVFGVPGEEAFTLLPRSLDDECRFLPKQLGAVVPHQAEDTITLEYYDLTTGFLVDSLTLPDTYTPKSILPLGESQVLLLVCDPEFDCELLLTWTVSRTSPTTICYTGPYYTRQNPDTTGLAGCQSYADQIASKYGITIAVGEAAAAAPPWDYRFESEYLERVLTENLKLLDSLLSQYPREVLAQTADHFGGLTLCLVRQIRGTAASGSLDTATGVQYIQNGQSYLALALGPYMEQALYHELFHAMETCVFAKSTAFDQWDSLNPAGFQYDYDFSANAQRNAGIYLENSYRAFVDTYSMSYPKEDRARIFEYAMLPGNTALFQADTMQKKLTAICTGLKEAYDLDGGPYLWEQYRK